MTYCLLFRLYPSEKPPPRATSVSQIELYSKRSDQQLQLYNQFLIKNQYLLRANSSAVSDCLFNDGAVPGFPHRRRWHSGILPKKCASSLQPRYGTSHCQLELSSTPATGAGYCPHDDVLLSLMERYLLERVNPIRKVEQENNQIEAEIVMYIKVLYVKIFC